MSSPSLSIIIPCLNEEKYLPLLLRDLSFQTHKNFEVIIVDGHSTDATITKIESFQKKLPHLTLLNSPLRNVPHQRNLGAKTAQGDYLLFIDADNRLPKWFIEGIVYRIHQLNPKIFTCWLEDSHYSDSEKIIPTLINYYIDLQQKTSKPFVLEAMIGFKKKVFFELGQFNPKLPVWEGAQILAKATSKGYRLHVFRDPRFTTSLRRIKTQGKIKTIVNTAQLELSRLLNLNHSNERLSSLYPVIGGTKVENIKDSNNLLKTIRNILSGNL